MLLRGMCVVLQNLNNRPELNDLRGHVMSVQADDRLVVELDRGGTHLLLRAKNLRQCLVLNRANVLTMEFVQGTSELQISADVHECYRQYVHGPDTELCVFIRPPDAQPAAQMSVLNQGLLLQAARLEHRGKLTRTAQLLGWVETVQDVDGKVVYKNDTLQMALLPTKEVYLMHTAAHMAHCLLRKEDR